MMNHYPRETKEFQPVAITVDGAAVTAGVELAVVLGDARPTAWTAATSLSGKIGYLIDSMAVGTYTVWARITSSPEVPVINCGSFRIT